MIFRKRVRYLVELESEVEFHISHEEIAASEEDGYTFDDLINDYAYEEVSSSCILDIHDRHAVYSVEVTKITDIPVPPLEQLADASGN